MSAPSHTPFATVQALMQQSTSLLQYGRFSYSQRQFAVRSSAVFGRYPRPRRLPDLGGRADQIALDLPAQGGVRVQEPTDEGLGDHGTTASQLAAGTQLPWNPAGTR